MLERCPLDKQHGEFVCRDGMLWALTCSEMAPPDSRMYLGPCDWPGHKTGGITHCCEGDRACPADDATAARSDAALVSG